MIEVNFSLDDIRFVSIKCEPGKEPTYRQSSSIELSAREFSAMNAVLETVRCLSLGRSIDLHFNPTVPHNAEDEKLVKLKWMRSGKLAVLEEDTPKRWMHASTKEEAMGRKRSFTCTRRLLLELPRRREVPKKIIIPGESNGNQD